MQDISTRELRLLEDRHRLVLALRQVLAVSRDRAAFVMEGPRAFARAERICQEALVACGENPEAHG